MARVTEKQEKFLKNLIYKGMSQREAYRDAYGNQRMKDKSVDECASRLLKNIKVMSRYEELKREKEGEDFFGLTKAEEKFVETLILGKSQRESYRIAFNCKNFKDKTVDEKASRLWNTGKIQARYKQLMNRIVREAEKDAIMGGEEILRELSETARSDITQVLDVKVTANGINIGLREDFNLKNVKEMYLDKNGVLRVKMYDRISAMKALGDMQGVKEKKLAEENAKQNNDILVEFEKLEDTSE